MVMNNTFDRCESEVDNNTLADYSYPSRSEIKWLTNVTVLMPVPIPPLLIVCYGQTLDLLKAGLWSKIDDPFAEVPMRAYHSFLHYVFSLPFKDWPEAKELCQMLTCRNVQILDLTPFETEHRYLITYDDDLRSLFAAHSEAREAPEKFNMLMDMLSRRGVRFPNVQRIILPKTLRVTDAHVKRLLKASPMIDYFHTNFLFDFSIIRHCKNLEYLRFHVLAHDFFQHLRGSTSKLPLLKNLRAVSVCFTTARFFGNVKRVARLLKHCPHLCSLGLLDTLHPIHRMVTKAQRKRKPPPVLKLQKCYWGIMRLPSPASYTAEDLLVNRTAFSNLVNTAVNCCPDVQQLLVQVLHVDCLRHLVSLSRLHFLCLNFAFCEEDYMPALETLLIEIGRRLTQLTLDEIVSNPISMICKHCPNLEILRVMKTADAEDLIERTADDERFRLHRLEKLTVNRVEVEDFLIFLMEKCPNLEELTLKHADCLNDASLARVLNKNNLCQLKSLDIAHCNLTEDGLKTLLKSTKKLKRVAFRNLNEVAPFVIREMGMGASLERLDPIRDRYFGEIDVCHF
ncbi:uncharacterized protein CDAR_476731 [Caerostris darwini]|uniref:Uncharacterized protein n=1 Tax=Caerostris darwini TaxID=1538125 RepID=A0AAV4TZG8_9ARAC|nr:uncharacterized protein CDAR_476731 [Caerostris darwini]